jgi:hypothetical protein
MKNPCKLKKAYKVQDSLTEKESLFCVGAV